jgi:hypothetical protein
MNTVKCPLCRVDVPIDKIDLQNRCLHPQCPLKRTPPSMRCSPVVAAVTCT